MWRRRSSWDIYGPSGSPHLKFDSWVSPIWTLKCDPPSGSSDVESRIILKAWDFSQMGFHYDLSFGLSCLKMLDTIKVCFLLTSQKNLTVKGWMKYHSFTLAPPHTFSPILLDTQNFNFRQFFTLSLPLQLVTPSILSYNISYTQFFSFCPHC